MSLETLLIEREIAQGFGRYARALDRREWALLDSVFAADVQADYNDGEYRVEGRQALVAMIRSHLDGCGPSQHLLGNVTVELRGEQVESGCYIRAAHRGVGARAALTFETLGEYLVRWRRDVEGWRAVHWRLRVDLELGTREVLGPG